MDRAWRGEHGVIGHFAPQLPPGHQSQDGPVITRPRLIELCFQTAGIQELESTGRMALPMHIDRVVLPTRASTGKDLIAQVEHRSDGRFDAQVLDPDGGVLVRLEGYGTIALPEGLDERLLDPLHAGLTAP